MQTTFYWHDYETFGADPSSDWPCQFAGIRTDENLNIIGKPLVEFCKPPADYIPKPMATLVTGITPQQAAQQGLSEPAFIKRIHQEFTVPGTCGVGYNSIRFDDEVTRYSLYRNFYDPYAREWQNGNSRWDIIDMVRMTYALRPEGITWPEGDNGAPSFRLELLTAANGLSHEAAHDALSDVHATIDFAKLIKNSKPQLYDYALSLRFKKRVLELINLAKPAPFLHVSSKYPAAQGCSALVMPIAQHPTNPNGVVVVDLSQSPDEWLGLGVSEIQRRLYTRTADLGDEARIQLKTIHINKSPMVGTPKLLGDAQAQRLNIDVDACYKNYERLQQLNPSHFANLLAALEPNISEPRDADRALYEGFISKQDRTTCEQVIAANGEQLNLDDFSFSDKRLPTLLFRYKARHWPQSLSAEEQTRWQQHCFERLEGEDLTYSLHDYFDEIDQLAEARTSERDQALLNELRNYGDALLAVGSI